MTCFSEMSGIASTGFVRARVDAGRRQEQREAEDEKPVVEGEVDDPADHGLSSLRRLLHVEGPAVLHRRAARQLRLGVDEEVGGRDDAVAFRQPLEDGDAVAGGLAGLHVARRERVG